MRGDDSQLPSVGDPFGKYRLVRLLGQGGMGAVYEAVHAKLGQRVAIKVLLPRFLDKPEVVGRFEREARAASRIASANVARVVDVDVSESGVPYMVMEFLEGIDVSEELALRKRLSIEEAVDIVVQACAGMAEAHALGIIHRDLKPSNLFLCSDGGARTVKVLDFGISKITHETDTALTATESSMGTPLYMSPEQVRSAKHVDARSDVWALGVILYELLTGRPPFQGSATSVAAAIVVDEAPPLRTLRSDLPEPLERIARRALEKQASARYQDVGALAVALMPFASAAVAARLSRDSSAAAAFPRITVGVGLAPGGDGSDASPTLPAGTEAATLPAGPAAALPPIAAPVDAVTAAPWTRADAAPTRRSGRLFWWVAPVAVVGAIAGVAVALRSPPEPPRTPSAHAPIDPPPASTPSAPLPEVPTTSHVAASAAPSVTAPKAAPSAASKPSARPKPTSTAAPVAPTALKAGENPIKL